MPRNIEAHPSTVIADVPAIPTGDCNLPSEWLDPVVFFAEARQRYEASRYRKCAKSVPKPSTIALGARCRRFETCLPDSQISQPPTDICTAPYGAVFYWESENAERAFLLFAIPSADIHPAGFASFSIGWSNLVVNRRHTSCTEGVHITQWALIVARCLGNFLLSQGCSRSNQEG